MSWDVDEKEFHETFAEIESERGIEEAKVWAWSTLDWTQKELAKETKRCSVDGEVYNAGRSEGRADVCASLRSILDPDDKNHWNLDGLLIEVERLYMIERLFILHDNFNNSRRKNDH
jgi:hypothetical protein